MRRPVVVESDLLTAVGGVFDLVIANLYADVLLVLARDPGLERALPRGLLLVSGVRDRRRAQVERAFAQRGFVRVADDAEAGWRGMLLRRDTAG
jgi:ribosomal protein L11 methylase PrmA